MEKLMNEFLTGKLIVLKQMVSSNLETFAQIENETSTLLLANDDIPFPGTLDDHRTFFEGISGKKEEFIFGIFDNETDELVGSCGVYGLNWKNSTCQVGIAIGKNWQGKGFGTDAMQTLISFIFNFIHINKIKLQVFSFNQSAIRSYEKCGFIREGILRNEVFRFGAFHDLYLFGLLREDWTAAREEV